MPGSPNRYLFLTFYKEKQLLKIDATQSQGLKRAKDIKLDSLRDLVDLLIRREDAITSGNEADFQLIEIALNHSLYSKDAIKAFWENLELLIAERLSGTMRVKRQHFPDSKADWFSNPPAEFETSHLTPFCFKRMESMISKSYEGSEIPYSNQNIGDSVIEYRDKNSDKMLQFIWDPRFWLSETEIRANLKMFTILVCYP